MSILNTIKEGDDGDMRVRIRADEILGSFDFDFFSLAFPAVMYLSVLDVFIFEIFQSIRGIFSMD